MIAFVTPWPTCLSLLRETSEKKLKYLGNFDVFIVPENIGDKIYLCGTS